MRVLLVRELLGEAVAVRGGSAHWEITTGSGVPAQCLKRPKLSKE